MAQPTRDHSEALYVIFQQFALDDQRGYYKGKLKRSRDAGREVNRIRAGAAFAAGTVAALSGLIVSNQLASGTQCGIEGQSPVCTLLPLLAIFGIVAPIIGAAFTTLSDLFQWDRLVSIYETAVENLEIADAQSPHAEMDEAIYWLALRAYSEGTLGVMTDETAQWGSMIRTPQQLSDFIDQAQSRTGATGRGTTPDGS